LEVSENVAIIKFDNYYQIGLSYTFVIDELESVVKTYTKPPIEKSIVGQQYFRSQIRNSQLSLDKKFRISNAMSFDQSYFTRTIGQILIQYKLEQKHGILSNHFKLFSGSGFGSIQAFSCAMSYETEELNRFFLGNLLEIFDVSIGKKLVNAATSILFTADHSKFKTKRIEAEIRNFFKSKNMSGKRTERDLTLKDCKTEIYIPAWDISRRTITITKDSYPDMPIYQAISATIFDPIFFHTKPMFPDMGIMAGDVVKNNDVYLKKSNPTMSVTSIGSPVRMFDKGLGEIKNKANFLKSSLLKLNDIKHDTDLDWSRTCGSIRYECTPIDECTQFATDEQSIQTAQKSGNINV